MARKYAVPGSREFAWWYAQKRRRDRKAEEPGPEPPPEPTGLLVDYPGAAAAYSLRSLRSDVEAVIRVRRSDNNAEQDFTAAQITDGTLVAFVGAGNDGLVTTWYDQSGNDNHATQATAANQPKIVNNGALVTENGKAAVSFDGNDFVRSASVSVPQPFTQIVLATLGAGLANDNNDYRLTYTSTNIVALYKDDALTPDTFNMFAGTVVTGIPANENQNLWFGVFSGAASEAYINNSLAVDGNAGSNAMSDSIIGSQPNGVKGWNGTIQELIVYPSDQSANRVGIETNINDHYEIFP